MIVLNELHQPGLKIPENNHQNNLEKILPYPFNVVKKIITRMTTSIFMNNERLENSSENLKTAKIYPLTSLFSPQEKPSHPEGSFSSFQTFSLKGWGKKVWKWQKRTFPKIILPLLILFPF